MKKKGWLIYSILSLFIVGTSLITSAREMNAADGGEAPTQGEITLFDDSSEAPKTSGSSEVQKSSDSVSGGSSSVKPKGKFPSTGELVKAGLSVGGLTLIAVAGIFLVMQKRNKAQENNGEGE
ncbi:LPXTG cell wall anchor domain-containing protein [Enterococcus quebecensis]|uniref:Gram-positive cocci surface proteins LPxTG domain-containing protein n=1 Tax=Enterococcus quebecensis TaxID=903983 RepID=A0A1E5GR56_9ENTE|nr:LPXTG cell wall anchor domain-containing protein [Enterococcus quebecensis]OEG15194.1 hypothetical protein BCR23_10175 [Enterococcus quebecensis]